VCRPQRRIRSSQLARSSRFNALAAGPTGRRF
jgi:hypothetical protein